MTTKSIIRKRLIYVSMMLITFAPGCSRVSHEADLRKEENDLKAIHLMYLAYQTAHNKPPSKVEDLKAIKDQDPQLYGEVYDRVVKGEYTIIWGTPQDAASRAQQAERPLAHRANVNKGTVCPILMGDGTVKRAAVLK
jgi:hypothetical protein